MKKITTLFITIFMTISLVTVNVFAVDKTFEKDGLTYTIIGENDVSVTAADLTQSEYNVPATITYNGVKYTVVSLGQRLFYQDEGNTALTKITLPDTLKSIESAAFMKCRSLTSIELPDDIQVIEMSTFEGCSHLKSIKLPDQLITIKADAFRGCGSLKSIHIPDTVNVIANNVFINCRSLESVVIPKNVEYLGASTLWYCANLKEVTLSNSIQTIEKNVFKYSPLFSKIMVMTEIKDQSINNQILTAIAEADNPPQIYRGVTHIQADQKVITALPDSKINLDSYFTKSFGVYDESGQSSSVMTIPENYKNVEYQLVGQHSDKTQIIGNQLFISDEEKISCKLKLTSMDILTT